MLLTVMIHVNLTELAELLKSEFPKVNINYSGKDKFMPEKRNI